MRGRPSKALLAGAEFFGYALGAILCAPVTLCAYCCFTWLIPGKCATRPPPPPLPPKSLPTKRIDIHSRPQVTQPKRCSFFHKLPLELRRSIYEDALGGRQVRVFIEAGRTHRRRRIRSRATRDFRESDVLERTVYWHNLPRTQDFPIPIAMLRVCRQLYTEAHALLFESNFFHVLPYELDLIVRCGLGESIALPVIRSLTVHYWDHAPIPLWTFYSAHWHRKMFDHIAAMPSLTHLSFQFFELEIWATDDGPEDLGPDCVLDSFWARRLLSIQNPNLTTFEMKFLYQHSSHAPPLEYSQWKMLEQRIRKLVIVSRDAD
ncbi:hypothetical protein C8F01DRAFT_1255377 [Mycena amicta]|nr:hypothetical protein C8F01DRAFT_1255377 [Mycena amicta]